MNPSFFGILSLDEDDVSLFMHVMKGRWPIIVDQYRRERDMQLEKITWLGDTALHVAVAEGLEHIVTSLLDVIRKTAPEEKDNGHEEPILETAPEEKDNGHEEPILETAPKEKDHKMSWFDKVLRVQNNDGSTPLHIAASIGSAAMCQDIASRHPLLVRERNNAGETPLFLAAVHGHTDAFLCLVKVCGDNDAVYSCCCRLSDGQTVLHSVIFTQYFDLAFQIICKVPRLVEKLNGDGDTPLRILARKPTAFQSGSKIGRWNWETLIYNCIFVDPLQEVVSRPNDKHETENQFTWSTCFRFLRNIVVNPKAQAYGHSKPDPEAPKGHDTGKQSTSGGTRRPLWLKLVKHIHMLMLVVLGMGNTRVNRLKELKEKHIWSVQIMNKLIEKDPNMYAFDKGGGNTGNILPNPESDPSDQSQPKETTRTINAKNLETPMLIAARNGITEMVKAILEKFPVAVNDANAEKKNIVLLAVETRQLELYKILLNYYSTYDKSSAHGPESPLQVNDHAFRIVDINGNSALHLAADRKMNSKSWSIPGAALQMLWDIEWHKFVENSMPRNFFIRYNKKGETPEEVFTESHKELAKEGGQWLAKTSESCSVVAALIATVAFATSTAIPGGTNDVNGKPRLENQFAFKMFGIASLVSLSFSVTSLSMFLSILTSRYQEKDFERSLPWKLLLGLTSLFVSIASVLISFCAGHFFVLGDTLKFAAYPVYAFTCLPISFFAVAQFPLYYDLILATFGSPFGGSSSRVNKFKKLFQISSRRNRFPWVRTYC